MNVSSISSRLRAALTIAVGLLAGYGAQANPLDRIYALENAKAISPKEALTYKIDALFNPGALPEELADTRPSRAATLAYAELFKKFPRLDSTSRARLAAYGVGSQTALARAGAPRTASALAPEQYVTLSGPEFAVDVAAYRIHYTESGVDKVSPAVLEAVKGAIGLALAVQGSELGMTMPPADTDGFYHIYLSDQETGQKNLYGFVRPINKIGDNPKSPFITENLAVSSVMVLDNDFNPEQFDGGDPAENARITVAHEHFHSVQFGYSFFEESVDFEDMRWFFESTAAWVETRVYPGSNGAYRVYSPDLLKAPGTYLFSGEGSWVYSAFLLHRYLQEHDPNGQFIPRKTLEAAITSPASLPNTLFSNAVTANTRFKSLSALAEEFTVANALRSPQLASGEGRYTYQDSQFLATDFRGQPIHLQTIRNMALTETNPIVLTNRGETLLPLGANYFRLSVTAPGKMTFKADNGPLDLAVITLGDTSASASVSSEISVQEGGTNDSAVLNPGEYYLRVQNPDSRVVRFSDENILSSVTFTITLEPAALGCSPNCLANLNVDVIKALRDQGEVAPSVRLDVVKSEQPTVSCLDTAMAAGQSGAFSLSLNESICPKEQLVDIVVLDPPAGFMKSKTTGTMPCTKKITVESLTSGQVITCNLAKGKASGDANADNKIDLQDFGSLKKIFGQKGAGLDSDFDGDEDVDLADFGIMKKYFGLSSD